MKILVVVDCQNDFIDGVLGTKEAQVAVPNIVEKITEYVENGDVVIFTRDTHYENYMETAEGKKLPVVHCIKNTDGWKIKPEIRNAAPADVKVIDKLTFGSVELIPHILEKYNVEDIEEIQFVGFCTDICVVSNVLMVKANLPETKISVIKDCCAGVTVASHEAALTTMQMCQIDII